MVLFYQFPIHQVRKILNSFQEVVSYICHKKQQILALKLRWKIIFWTLKTSGNIWDDKNQLTVTSKFPDRFKDTEHDSPTVRKKVWKHFLAPHNFFFGLTNIVQNSQKCVETCFYTKMPIFVQIRLLEQILSTDKWVKVEFQ